MSRNRWQLILGLVVVLSVMLTACVAPSAPAGDGMAAEDSGDMMDEVMLPDDAAEDQILNVVHEGGCGSGPFPGIDYGSPCNFGHMFMPPFLVDIDGNVTPGLFTTDWEVNDDFTEYIFHIQEEAVWSDGKSITAQDALDEVAGEWTRIAERIGVDVIRDAYKNVVALEDNVPLDQVQ